MVFQVSQNFLLLGHLKKSEKILQKSKLENYKKLSSQIQRQDSQSLRVPPTDSNNRIEIFKFLKFLNIFF